MLNQVAAGVILAAALFASTAGAAEKADSAVADRPVPTAQEIAGWIAQLDDNRYLVREQATRQLLDAGGAALDPLLATANGERPEPADRAVWIMRRLARSRDNDQAIAALERIVQLSGRPALVEKAEIELAERSIAACQAKLSPLGAELVMEPAQFDFVSVVPLLHVRLGEKWKGTADDLRCLAQLRRQLHYRLEGAAVNDEVVKFFEEKDQIAYLQLWNAHVSVEAVDALKSRHPDAMVYVRGNALMGVEAKNDPAGALVTRVPTETGAAAPGILVGDVIASMDGHMLPDFDRLTARIAQHQPGETVVVEIIRGGDRNKLSVTLGTRPEGQ